MRRLSTIFTLFLCLGFLTPSTAQDTTVWTNSPDYSDFDFTVPFMVVRQVEGKFDSYNIIAKTTGDTGNVWENAQVEVTIPVKDVNTGSEKRDKHLQQEDFFQAEKHPKITYKSFSFQKTGDENYRMKGELTMRGHTDTVTVRVLHKGTIQDSDGNTLAGFRVEGTVNRMDYNIYWNEKMDNGQPVVPAEVRFSGNIVMKKLD